MVYARMWSYTQRDVSIGVRWILTVRTHISMTICILNKANMPRYLVLNTVKIRALLLLILIILLVFLLTQVLQCATEANIVGVQYYIKT